MSQCSGSPGEGELLRGTTICHDPHMTYALTGTGIWDVALRYGDRGEASEAAAELEELGFSAVWIPDAGGEDLFGAFDALLSATEGLTVASGILNLWMQEPVASAAEYDRLVNEHGDRLLIGIGVSHAPMINQMLEGSPYVRPIDRMADYLTALDDAEPTLPASSRVLAALGPRMLQLARERTGGRAPVPGQPRAHRHSEGDPRPGQAARA